MNLDPDRRVAAALAAVTAAWSVVLALLGSTEAALFLVPMMLLAVPLALGRYLGEDKLEALRRTSRRARPRPARRAAAPSAPARALVARGGTLIATSIAKRPPPLRLGISPA